VQRYHGLFHVTIIGSIWLWALRHLILVAHGAAFAYDATRECADETFVP
jgi:hypothetical protein